MIIVKKDLDQLHTFLRYVYGAVPIVAGIDKFTNLLTDWTDYLNGFLKDMLPFDPGIFMIIIGLIEITAGILVLLAPRLGGIVVMTWLSFLAFILLFNGSHFDVAVRDLVMASGAFAFVRLTSIITAMEKSREMSIKSKSPERRAQHFQKIKI